MRTTRHRTRKCLVSDDLNQSFIAYCGRDLPISMVIFLLADKVFGVPSIRTDIAAPRTRRVSERRVCAITPDSQWMSRAVAELWRRVGCQGPHVAVVVQPARRVRQGSAGAAQQARGENV